MWGDAFDPAWLIGPEALAQMEDAIRHMISCAGLRSADHDDFAALLPESTFAKGTRLLTSGRQTDLPYMWQSRPDDWTAMMRVWLQDSRSGQPPPGGWSFSLKRPGPVALAEARDYLSARERNFAEICKDEVVVQGTADAMNNRLRTRYDGRGAVWYDDPVDFDSKAIEALPSGERVLQVQMSDATIPAASPAAARPEAETHLKAHFREVSAIKGYGALALRGQEPLDPALPPDPTLSLTLSRTEERCDETAICDLSILSRASYAAAPSGA